MPNSFLLAHLLPSGTTSALPAGMKVHSRYRIIEHLNISGEELGGNCLKILGMDLLEYEKSVSPLSTTFFHYYIYIIIHYIYIYYNIYSIILYPNIFPYIIIYDMFNIKTLESNMEAVFRGSKTADGLAWM